MSIITSELVKRYKKIATKMMGIVIPSLSEEEIDEAINYSIEKRFKDTDCTIDNNYKKITVNTTISQITQYILEKEPIMTAYGCLFSKHSSTKNPLYDMIEEIVTIRDNFKKEMFKYPKGSEMYNKYNLLQLLAKVDANAIYGALGNYSCMFYNIYVATAITKNGQSAIASSIMLFESLLANNVKFGSLDEIITFIDNVTNEKDRREYKDYNIIDKDIERGHCFLKIMSSCGYEWVPTPDDSIMIHDIISRLSQEDVNRLYYKNNMFDFCDNKVISNMIIGMLSKLTLPFLDPNHPPKVIQGDLDILIGIIKEYVYYEYQIIDKLDRVRTMTRDVVLITDTDSCIISLEPWYRFILEKTKGIDMEVKHEVVETVDHYKEDEFGDRELAKIVDRVDFTYDFDFYNEKLIQGDRLADPVRIIPQDGLRHSIINIMSFIVSKLILDYMYKYTINYQSAAPDRKCLLIMKNEFLFKSILLTDGKKNYASYQEVQEGNLVPKKEALAISGLTLDKVGIAKSTSKELKRILYEEILDSQDGVDQIQVLKDLAILERRIFESIMHGETKYHKPARIKPISVYEKPMSIQGIKAAVAYNMLKDEHEEAINLENRNSILVVKVNIDKKTIAPLEMKDPERFKKISALLATKEFKGDVSAIAIPFGMDIPKWIIEFIDYVTIIHDNLTSFPIESIGITTLNSKNVPFSNVLEL